jgi:hypothetical protein
MAFLTINYSSKFCVKKLADCEAAFNLALRSLRKKYHQDKPTRTVASKSNNQNKPGKAKQQWRAASRFIGTSFRTCPEKVNSGLQTCEAALILSYEGFRKQSVWVFLFRLLA